METSRRVLGRLAGPLAALAAGAAALGVFWGISGRRAVMNGLVTGFSRPVRQAVSAVLDPLPVSGAELLITLGVLAALAVLAGAVRRAARRQWLAAGRRLAILAAVGVWIWVGVCLLWGAEYYADSFAETEGIPVQPVSVEQLAATAAWFAQRVNETADQVPRDETGVFAVSTGEIFARAQGLYDGVSRRYPSLAGPQRSPKAAGYSYLMSLTGFTGYIFPFTGESTLNVDCPAVFLSVTVAHEFAHQRGVAPEQEANYVAVAACADSGDPVYTYSGWLFGFLHLSNALYGADPDRWAPVYASLCESAQRDMAANNAYWAAMEGPVQTAAESTYSGFLQSYGQELGMRSYGACVDLLVARWCPANLAENP